MSSPVVEVRHATRDHRRNTSSTRVFLDEVFVPDDCVVGEFNGGWRWPGPRWPTSGVSLVAVVGVRVRRAGAAPGGQGGTHSPLGQVGTLVCEGHAIDLLALRVDAQASFLGPRPARNRQTCEKLLGMLPCSCPGFLALPHDVGHKPETARRRRGRRRSPRNGSPNGPHWARTGTAEPGPHDWLRHVPTSQLTFILRPMIGMQRETGRNARRVARPGAPTAEPG